MSIVVTAATGHLGRLVVTDLLAAGVPADEIVAAVRDEAKAGDLTALGVRVRLADYDRPGTLADAFQSGDRVLLVSSPDMAQGRRVEQHTAVVEAARAADVAQLAYTSVLGGPKADFLVADDHRATEEAVVASGLPWTFLRNGWYTEVYTAGLTAVLERGAIVTAAGDGRVASAARADYAAAAAAVLRGDGHLGAAYELSGDTAWSFDEFAAEVSRISGTKVAHTRVSPGERAGALREAGLPEPVVEILADVDDAIGRGVLSATPGDLGRLIGRPTTTLAASVRAALGA